MSRVFSDLELDELAKEPDKSSYSVDELDHLASLPAKSPQTAKQELEKSGLPVTPEGVEEAQGQEGPQFNVTVPAIGAPNPAVAEIRNKKPESLASSVVSGLKKSAEQIGENERVVAESGVDTAALVNKGLQALKAPAEAYERAIDAESMRPTVGKGRVEVAIDEGMRQSAKLVAGLVADPTNWPFLASGSAEVRPALRVAADSLFAAMQTVQLHGAYENLKWDDPSTWSDAAKSAAFALLGWHGVTKAVSGKIVDQAASRDRAELDATKRRLERQNYYAPPVSPEKVTNQTVTGAPAGSAFEPRTADEVENLRKYEERQAAKAQPNQAARRATLEVPETTVPESQHFTDAELDELTRPEEKPVEGTPAPAAPSDETVTLYRGQKKNGKPLSSSKLPSWITEQSGKWFTDDPGKAKTYAGEDGEVVKVEVPKSAADSWAVEKRPGEYLLPDKAVARAVPHEEYSDAEISQLAQGATSEPPVEETAAPPAEDTTAVSLEPPAEEKTEAADTRPPLLVEAERLKDHPVRAKEPETVRNSEFASFERQVRSLAERNLPSLVPDIDAAVKLHDDGDTGNAIAKLELVRQQLHGAGRTLAEAAAKKAGLELPPDESSGKPGQLESRPEEAPQPKPKAPTKRQPVAEETPKTPRDRLIWDGASAEMEAWADSVDHAQEQLGRGESSMTMESNAAGKEIEEEQTKRASSIKSLGAKEGSPLEEFRETPNELKEAIRDRGGRLKDSKKAGLYRRIHAAFREAYENTHGEAIDTYLKTATDEQKRDLFGDDVGTLQFEDKPVSASESVLGRTEQEGLTKLAGGRPIDQLKEGRAFDEEGLVKSELFGGRGGRQQFLGTDERGDSSELGGQEEGDTSFDFSKAVQSRSLGELGQGGGEAGQAVRETLRQNLVPTVRARPSIAPKDIMKLIVRRGAADLAARDARASKSLEQARRYFSSIPEDQQLRFIDAIENGSFRDLPTAEQGVARTMRRLLDDTWKEVRQRNGTRAVIENYFPHIWADPEEAAKTMRKYYAKRPLQGSKSFLKQRVLMTVAEGREQGLELAFKNPVDLVLAQLHQENKYITGHDMVEEMKGLGVIQFRNVFDRRPGREGLAKIDDPIGTVYGPPTMKVKEAYDEIMFDQLNQFARSLGIQHFRQINIGRHADGWGYTSEGTNKVFTKVGGPETILTHEIGHQLDYRYGLKDLLAKKGDTAKELRALADQRYAGREDFVDAAYKEYVRKGSEKIANLIHAIVHAPDLAQEIAPQSVQAIRELAMFNPELKPLLDIKPSLVIGSSEYDAPIGGMVTKGHWWAPQAAADVINNYLSPGLAGKKGWQGKAFNAMRATGNLLNQVQLGASAFHFTFTALDAATSQFSSGVQDILGGRFGRGVSKMAQGNILVAPWTTYLKGSKVLREFYAPGSQGEYYARVVDSLIKGGGRVKMDSFYRNSAVEKFWDAWGKHNFIGVAWRAVPAIVQQVGKPIMEHWVPRLKLGAFAELSHQMLDQLPPDADPLLQRRVLGQAWDSIDNRMGQLVYDNLFWDRTLKDLGMVSVRSLGWNLGTWRELGGAGKDVAQALAGKGNVFQSGRMRMTPRMAYALSLPIVIGMHGAAAMYVMSGKGPQELKDYFFPQTGKVSPTGEPERVSLPSYAKDLYSYGHDFPTSAIQSVEHKLHPDISVVFDMLENKDFYGTEIRHEDDPPVQQFKDAMEYIGKQYVPFSARNLAQRLNTEGVADTARASVKQPGTAAASFFGVVPAPKSLEQTAAERLALKYAAAERSEGGRTKVQFDRSQTRNAIIRAYQAKDPTAAAQQSEALKSGHLAPSDLPLIQQERNQKPLQRYLRSAGLEQLLNVWKVATPEERKVLRPMLSSRRGSQSLTAEQRATLLPQVNKALAEQ